MEIAQTLAPNGPPVRESSVSLVLVKTIGAVVRGDFLHEPVARNLGDNGCERYCGYCFVAAHYCTLAPPDRCAQSGVQEHFRARRCDAEARKGDGRRLMRGVDDADGIYRLGVDERKRVFEPPVFDDVVVEYVALLGRELFGITKSDIASLGDERERFPPIKILRVEHRTDAYRPGQGAATSLVNADEILHLFIVSVEKGL